MTHKLSLPRFSPWLFAAILVLCACFAHAQVTVSPIQGLGSVQFFDNNGEPVTSGVLYSFAAGTSRDRRLHEG